MSDKTKIIGYLKTHSSITCTQAIHSLGVYNLRSRACEIPGIRSVMVPVVRRDGVKTRVARYSMG